MKKKTPYILAVLSLVLVGWLSYLAIASILETVPKKAVVEKEILSIVLVVFACVWSVIIAVLIGKGIRRYMNKKL